MEGKWVTPPVDPETGVQPPNIWVPDTTLTKSKGIQVEIYRDTAPTVLVDILNARMEPTYLEELSAHGAGSFKISVFDPKIVADPSLLDYRNMVKIRVNGNIEGGFIIQTKKKILVGEEEDAALFWEISGEGFRSWSRDATVHPWQGFKRKSADTRYFNFATEEGSWYNSSEWIVPVNLALVRTDIWATAPADWPDVPWASWVWGTARSGGSHPLGTNYFRYVRNVTVAAAYALFLAADNVAEIYVDGELLASTAETGWTNTTRVNFDLEVGWHIIGIKVTNYDVGSPGALIAALFTYGDPAVPTSATLVGYTGQNTWRVLPYPSAEPGWSPGEILLTLLAEAEARGVRFPSNITPTFTAALDSAGNPWPPPISYSFGVGSNYEQVIETLEELSCDIWLDPDTLELNAWIKRGYDRTTGENPIIFEIGKNLISADEGGQADIANKVALQTPEGWAEVAASDSSSVTKYGVVETQMATKLSINGSTALTDELFRQKALPEKTATFEIIPFAGHVPFTNFSVGDYVLAPGESGQESRRVMSISVSEDAETGHPVFATEFDTIFKDRQEELEKAFQRLTNSGGAGGGFSSGVLLPPTDVVVQPPPTTPLAVPDQPSGFTVVSTGRTAPDGSVHSDFYLEWNAVSTALGFGTVEVDHYEVWGRPRAFESDTSETMQLISTADDLSSSLQGYSPDDWWSFRVRAVSTKGMPGYYTPEIAIQGARPDLSLGVPSAPDLSSKLSIVLARWDGLLGGDPPGPNFWYLYAQTASDSGGPWVTVQGQQLNRAGEIAVVATRGDTLWVRFRATDTLGRSSDPSTEESIVVLGAVGGDIEDESLSGDKIIAGSIEVTHVSPSFGSTLNLEANGQINLLITGQQNAQSTLAAQQSNIEALATNTTQTAAQAAAATAAVDAAQIELDNLAGVVEDNNELVTGMATYYRFGVDGARIGKTDDPFELVLRNNRIEILENGVVVSYWDSGRMIVPSFVGDQVVLANHKIEKFGNGTVVRKV